VDVDIHTIPPSTPARRQFEDSFEQDLSKCLKVNTEFVKIEVINVKPAAGMDWLALVEFDIYVAPDHQPDENGELDDELEEEMEIERMEHRRRLLKTLLDMLADRTSPLYTGFVTCKLDPTYERNLRSDYDDMTEVPMVSTDGEIADIMERYKDVALPPDALERDNSHFRIYVHWEGTTSEMRVPNPFMLHRGKCVIWPFEVKKALGLLGTLQELWMEPIALVPKNMPKALSQPIVFEPSARHDGCVTINAAKLKADLTYDVQMEDFREEQLSKLTHDQVDAMHRTFNQYDLNGDGGISKREMEDLVRRRIQERKELIEEKYAEFISHDDVSPAELEQADVNRKEYLQHLNEAQAKLLTMFDAADVNHDGILSLHEFLLAESWWLQCALNPEGTHLF
jgi:Ca2+-binding EF-hand superfamily protein